MLAALAVALTIIAARGVRQAPRRPPPESRRQQGVSGVRPGQPSSPARYPGPDESLRQVRSDLFGVAEPHNPAPVAPPPPPPVAPTIPPAEALFGETAWRYNGYVVIDGRLKAVLSNASTGESDFPEAGEVFRDWSVVAISAEGLSLRSASGATQVLYPPPMNFVPLALPATANPATPGSTVGQPSPSPLIVRYPSVAGADRPPRPPVSPQAVQPPALTPAEIEAAMRRQIREWGRR